MGSDEVEILLVEDNPNDAELAIRALKARNLANKLIWLKDGVEALDFIFAQGQYADRSVEDVPKVVLLDLKLPRVNGLEVLEKIKSDKRTMAIPVVVLTSSSEERDIVTSYNLGVNSYILKPVDFDKFIDAVKEVGLYWLLMNKTPRHLMDNG
ncbi:MAG TPA: response regulator [Thermodesulfovibrionales bacterium]|nr:response regulator [Thermodesulfovibrionales bacterium]